MKTRRIIYGLILLCSLLPLFAIRNQNEVLYDSDIIIKTSAAYTITDPNSNTVWDISSDISVNIQWNPSGDYFSVYIYIYKGGVEIAYLGEFNDVGSSQISLDASVLDLEPGSDYQIQLYSASILPMYLATSDYFTVVNTNYQESITVITPSINNVWRQGQSYDIRWNWTGYQEYVDINLICYSDTSNSMAIIESEVNNGEYFFSVPDRLGNANDYKIRVEMYSLGLWGGKTDQRWAFSDYFTISTNPSNSGNSNNSISGINLFIIIGIVSTLIIVIINKENNREHK